MIYAQNRGELLVLDIEPMAGWQYVNSDTGGLPRVVWAVVRASHECQK